MIKNLDGLFETVTFRQNLEMRINFSDRCEDFPQHWHTSLEIIRVKTGWYEICADNQLYHLEKGETAILRPGTIHSLKASPVGSRVIYLAEPGSLKGIPGIGTVLSLLPQVTVITAENTPLINEKVRTLLLSMEEEYQAARPFYEISLYSLLCQLMASLGQFYITGEARTENRLQSPVKYADRFLEVCSYINSHFTENLTLDGMSSMAGFSRYYFSRQFKLFTGSSFYRYLNLLRITRAEQLLANPDYTVTEAARLCGFSSQPAFIRMFKLMKGCTPTKFRKMYSSAATVSLRGKESPLPEASSAPGSGR